MIQNPPKISVIVPVYNKDKYLRECIDSILAQTLNEIEIICIDDCSTDGSNEILKNYEKKDSRIKIIRHNENKGIIQSRKSGMETATGSFIAFVDADDLAHPEMCKTLYKVAIEKDADFVQCNAKIYDPEKILGHDLLHVYNKGMGQGKKCTYVGREIFKRYRRPIRNILFLGMYKNSLSKIVAAYINEKAPKRGDDDLLSFFFTFFAKKFVLVEQILYSYRASETSSNLNKISFELAKSQIIGRAHAIQYAEWFIMQNGIKWDRKIVPYSTFIEGIVDYSASFIDRYVEHCASEYEKDELLKLFGDCFGGDAVLYLLKRVDAFKKITGNNYQLIKELNGVYASRSWKITAPLRSVARIFRGY